LALTLLKEDCVSSQNIKQKGWHMNEAKEEQDLVESWRAVGFPNLSEEKANKMEKELELLVSNQIDKLLRYKNNVPTNDNP